MSDRPPKSLRINLVSFRTFICPLFPKPVFGSDFFCRFLRAYCSNIYVVRKGGGCTGNTTGYDGVHLIYAGGHCHAPSCVSMELFNADTGKLLCRHDPVYGQSHEVSYMQFFISFFVYLSSTQINNIDLDQMELKIKRTFVTSSKLKFFQNPSCSILEKINENYDKNKFLDIMMH